MIDPSEIEVLPKLRKPEKKEARRFVQACKSIVISSVELGGESGAQAERTVAHWIARLTDLTPEQVDELTPLDFEGYQVAMNVMLAEVLGRPLKKL